MGWLGISCDVEGKGWETLVSFSGKGLEFGGRISTAFFFSCRKRAQMLCWLDLMIALFVQSKCTYSYALVCPNTI